MMQALAKVLVPCLLTVGGGGAKLTLHSDTPCLWLWVCQVDSPFDEAYASQYYVPPKCDPSDCPVCVEPPLCPQPCAPLVWEDTDPLRAFVTCLSGPGPAMYATHNYTPPPYPSCLAIMDADKDGDVDLRDWQLLTAGEHSHETEPKR